MTFFLSVHEEGCTPNQTGCWNASWDLRFCHKVRARKHLSQNTNDYIYFLNTWTTENSVFPKIYTIFELWESNLNKTNLYINCMSAVSYQWRRPLWTVFHAHCTTVGDPLCRWFVWRWGAAEAQIYTGWWSVSWEKDPSWQRAAAGPAIPHCLHFK